MLKATIEVASNGYIVNVTPSGEDGLTYVYTSVLDALQTIARNICYEQIDITSPSVPDSTGGPT